MSWFWKHNKKKEPVIINDSCYKKLPDTHKAHFSPTSPSAATHHVTGDDDNFGLSMAVGMATGSIGLGYIAGNSLSGAVLGEMMSESSHTQSADSFSGFGGGDGGGAGAGGDWSSSSTDNSSSYDSGSSSSDSSSYSDSSSSYSDSSSSFDSGSSSSDSSF